jgi:hypothetical protein
MYHVEEEVGGPCSAMILVTSFALIHFMNFSMEMKRPNHVEAPHDKGPK